MREKILGIGMLLVFALSGCAGGPKQTDVTLQLKADESINNGILLPIDVVAVEESKAASILSISPDEWFGSDQRERLPPEEIQKLAIKDGGVRTVTVKVHKEAGKIIIYADYESTSQREQQQLVIDSKKESFHDSYLIKVKKNLLELVP